MLNPECRGVGRTPSANTLKLSVTTRHVPEMLSALSQAAECLPGFCDDFLDLLEIGDEPFVVELDRLAASRTDEVFMRFYPSDGLLRLVAAFRARQPELFPIKHFPLLVVPGDINTNQADEQC